MRILFLTIGAGIGGGSLSLLTLIRQLQPRGVECPVFCPCDGPLVGAVQAAGADCQVLDFDWLDRRRPGRSIRGLAEWRRRICDVGPDLIHVNAFGAARAVALPAKLAGVPWVCHFRFGASETWVKWSLRGMPKPQAFLFNSEGLHNELRSACDRYAPRVPRRVVYNGIDIDAFRCAEGASSSAASAASAAASTAASGLSRGRVGIIAHLMPVKGHEVFLAMAKALLDRGVDAEFLAAGKDRGCGEEVARLVERLGIESRVRLLGFREDVPQVVGGLDVVVCSSHEEPFGRCLIEGMACGKPVVATRVGGIPEVVEDGVTGFLVERGDHAAMADRVEQLLADADLRRRMGRAGRERVERLFSAEAHAEEMLAVYREVLSDASGRQPEQFVSASGWSEPGRMAADVSNG